jgi:antitoxin VapB
VIILPTAKLFTNGKSQAVRLPEECRFPGSDVMIQKIGDAVIMFPREKSWEVFIHGLNSFSDDFMQGGRK